MTVLGLIGALHAIAIALTRRDVRQIAAPDAVAALGQHHFAQLLASTGIEQAQLHFFGVLGEHGKAGAAAVPVGAERSGGAAQRAAGHIGWHARRSRRPSRRAPTGRDRNFRGVIAHDAAIPWRGAAISALARQAGRARPQRSLLPSRRCRDSSRPNRLTAASTTSAQSSSCVTSATSGRTRDRKSTR